MLRTLGTTIAVIVFATSLEAQTPVVRQANTQPPPPAPSRAREGQAASPPQPQPAAVPQYASPVYIVSDGYGYYISGAPYVVLTDGSVLANFGNGYERVLRPCAPPQKPLDMYPNGLDALGRIPLQVGSRGQLGGTMPARDTAACYRTDSSGRAVVQ